MSTSIEVVDLRARIVERKFVVCPACGRHEFPVDRLIREGRGQSFGPWPCQERECRARIRGRVLASGEISIEHDINPAPRGLTLLKLGDLYLIIEEGEKVDPGLVDYFYHSHQCPQNLLRRAFAVFDERGSDPHGVLRFVGQIDDTPDNRMAISNEGVGRVALANLFRLFDTDGHPIEETAW